MASATTDVRQWLREQGHEVGDRGAIRQDLRDLYDDAHARDGRTVIAGEVITSAAAPPAAPGDDSDDYPEPGAPAAPPAAPAGPPATGERPPRRPVTDRKPAGSRIFGRGRRRKGRKRVYHPRVPLGDFLEDTWLDLAWLAAPIPPLAMMLEMQAPFAGAVLDAHVAGTPADDMLQPLARYAHVYRALNGLVGPPMMVALICLEGRRDEQGQFDTRTQLMFGMLRYSLLQMVKVSDLSADEIGERVQGMAERNRVVDTIVARLFGFPLPGQQPAAPRDGDEDQDDDPAQQRNGRAYPPPPTFDGTGADPGRMMLTR